MKGNLSSKLTKLEPEIITIILIISGLLFSIVSFYNDIKNLINNIDCSPSSDYEIWHLQVIMFTTVSLSAITILSIITLFRSITIDLEIKKDEDKPYVIEWDAIGFSFGILFIISTTLYLMDNYININEFIGATLLTLSLLFITGYRLYNKNHYFKG